MCIRPQNDFATALSKLEILRNYVNLKTHKNSESEYIQVIIGHESEISLVLKFVLSVYPETFS